MLTTVAKRKLTELLPHTIAWATQRSQLILRRGAPLDDRGLAVACAVGVKHAERIRVWKVEYIPAPGDPELRRAAIEQNLIGPGTRGLSLGRSYRLPRGVSYTTLHDSLKASGFVIYAGQGELSRTLFRISTLGRVTAQDMERLLRCFGQLLG
jgi:hypothetical protein